MCSSCPVARAAVTTLQQEVKAVKTSQDNIARERDKLKSDLQVGELQSMSSDASFSSTKHFPKVANERSCSLAIEIDEQNSRQDDYIGKQIHVG